MDWVSDYREFTKPYILEQYKDSEKLLGLIGSVLDQCTQAEGMVQELSGLYNILTSEGIQLDIIGKIVGVTRLNRETDAIYRARLLIGSHYTDIPIAEAVRALVKEATKSDRVGIYPDWPAGFYVVPEVLLDDFGNLLESMTSSGVSVTLGTWLMTEEGLYIAQEDNDCPIVVDQQPWEPGALNTLLRIAEAEVSMLTIDGSDGKGNEFILNAVSDDGQPMYGITWISQDTSIATVTSNGDGLTATVRGVGIGAASLGTDVLIYASYNGVVKECLFTIYNTLPSADVEGAGLWAIKGGQGDGIEVYFRSYNVPIEPLTYVYVDYSDMYTQNVHQDSAFRPISSTSFNHPVIIYDGNALRYAKRIATVNGASYSYIDYKTSSSITPSIESRHKILLNSGMFVNNVQQSLSLFYKSPPGPTPNDAVIIFNGTQKKIIAAIASNASINMSDLTSPLMSYICQNYVKFTDYDSYVNRTKILNMGTLGHSCDMEANNVPESWFNI